MSGAARCLPRAPIRGRPQMEIAVSGEATRPIRKADMRAGLIARCWGLLPLAQPYPRAGMSD